MYQTEIARLMRMMDSYNIPALKPSGGVMSFTDRVEWLIENANQQSVQADGATCSACQYPFEGYKHTNNCPENPRR